MTTPVDLLRDILEICPVCAAVHRIKDKPQHRAWHETQGRAFLEAHERLTAIEPSNILEPPF